VVAIVEASEDAIFSVSRTHVVESWNSGCVRLFDLQPWLAVLRPLDGLFPAPLGGLLGQMIDQAAAGHPVRNAGWPGCTEGPARWVVSMRAVRARDGDASSVSVIVRDISAEIAATQALDDERRFIRTVLDTMPIAVSVRDALGCVLLANQRFDALFGKDGGSTTGTRHEDRIPDAAEVERMMHRDAEVLRSGLPVTYERRIRVDGVGDVDLHTVKVPLAQSGETRILTASVDVSDRIRAQDDLRRERAFMRTVIDTDPTLISVKDARGRFLLANRAAAEALGCTVEALEGHCLSEALPGANIDAVIARHDAEALRLQRPVTHEECQRVAGGKERWFSSIRLPLAGADGEPVVLGVSTDITEMRLQARRIHELKNFDPLTGLPNRMLIEDRLQMALATAERDRSRVAVMFVDLDHFKTVNDSLGHPAGDRLLVGVAKRIRAVLRDSDSVGRLGGDEFLLVLPQVDGPEDAALIANKLLAALEGAFDIMDHSLTVNASIGIAFYPEDGATPHLLVQNADAAMYHAKEQGRSCYRFFTRALNARAARSLAMEHGMRRGLHDGEFELWYQPVYALADGSVAGMEALVRWRRSTGELLMPGDFIGVAEERGLISHLGRWVLEAACAFAATRSRAGLPAIPIAVNLSPIQLRQQGLAAMIDGTLRATGVDPSLIELELTEGSIMHDIGAAIDVLQQIRALGVRIAVDDFGTGHSSLAWLRQLPIDKLKIDRAFVANVPANAVDTVIFRTIVAMASAMGIRTVAEGVETREQLDCVRALGCDLVQGYLLAKPTPEGDIARVTGMRVDLSRKRAASEG
jgi:diguanylate cyclase (GGDEF)-like protein/PAS domain S-box-containing protein